MCDEMMGNLGHGACKVCKQARELTCGLAGSDLAASQAGPSSARCASLWGRALQPGQRAPKLSAAARHTVGSGTPLQLRAYMGAFDKLVRMARDQACGYLRRQG